MDNQQTSQSQHNTYWSPYNHGSIINGIFVKLYNIREKIYSDQMGRFPILSSRGNKYVMIVYEKNSKHNHGGPIKPCTEADLTISYEKIDTMFMSQGLQPKLHILYN